jgi:predicted amidophosphoribosyltransferase
MGYDVYCPFCKEDFDDDGEWFGQCPTCGKWWDREENYSEETGDCWYEIRWEDL